MLVVLDQWTTWPVQTVHRHFVGVGAQGTASRGRSSELEMIGRSIISEQARSESKSTRKVEELLAGFVSHVQKLVPIPESRWATFTMQKRT